MSEQTPTPPAFTAAFAAAKKPAAKKTAKKKSAAKKTTAKKSAAKKAPTKKKPTPAPHVKAAPSKKVSTFKYPQDFYALRGNIEVLTEGLMRISSCHNDQDKEICELLKKALVVQVHGITELTKILFPNLSIGELIEVSGNVTIQSPSLPRPVDLVAQQSRQDTLTDERGTVVPGTPSLPYPGTSPVPIVG